MSELKAADLTVTIEDMTVVKSANFTVASGELAVLLGANGAGKSSLIKASLGMVPLSGGSVTLNGKAVHKLKSIDRAKEIAYLPQIRPLAWPNTVRDVVSLGRYSYGAALGRLSPQDAMAVDEAIASCGLTHLTSRRADTLSGGELARVHCARAFASEAPLLIADEPTAALDPKHQLIVMELIKDFVRQGGGALVVLHDVAMAARYADRLIWMNESKLVAAGSVADTLSEDIIASVYGVQARVSGYQVEMLRAI